MAGKGKWTRTTLRMPDNSGWRSKSGYQIFVADRGAVRFDFPHGWTFVPDVESAKFFDVAPPDDNCRLEVSFHYLRPGVDWSQAPLARFLRDVARDGATPRAVVGDIVEVKRSDLKLVWTESAFLDKVEGREGRSRMALAIGSNIQVLITLDFWPEDAERLALVWDEVLRSLTLGHFVKDPFRHRLD